MAINTPYVTLSEASALLIDRAAWENAEPEDQNRALEIGRAYIDSKYSCVYFDEDNPPDAIKVANAELAYYYLNNTTNFFGVRSDIGLTRKRVKAGSVESEKEFDNNESDSKDLYPDVTLILSEYCKYLGSFRFVTR